jgi:predicted transcriptional regulator
MTIVLKPATEARLKEKAQREGRDPNTLADALLADVLEQEAYTLAEAAAIQEGLDAIAAGRVKPLEQYLAEQRAKRGLPDTWPDSIPVKEVAPGIIEVE